MSKTIRFKENSLIAIKEKLNEIMVGTDGVSHNDVYVNEKVSDEFAPVTSIGGEEKNGDVVAAGNNFHMEQDAINENNNISVRGDLDKTDHIDFFPHDNPKEEGYTADNIMDFEPYYDIECYDIEGNTLFAGELTVNELYDYFPQAVVHAITSKQARKVNDYGLLRIDDIERVEILNEENVTE